MKRVLDLLKTERRGDDGGSGDVSIGRTVSGAAKRVSQDIRRTVRELSDGKLSVRAVDVLESPLFHSSCTFALTAGTVRDPVLRTEYIRFVGPDVAYQPPMAAADALADAAEAVGAGGSPSTRLLPMATSSTDGYSLLHAASVGMWGVHLDGVLSDGRSHVQSACDRNPILYSLLQFHRCTELRLKLFSCWVGEELQRLRGSPQASLTDEDREVWARFCADTLRSQIAYMR